MSASAAVRGALEAVIAFGPRLLASFLILLLGLAIGWLLGGVVRRMATAMDVDEAVMGTPLERPFESAGGVSRVAGRIAAYYVYLVAVFAATDALGVDLLSAWLSEVVSYVPALVGGVLIIVIGFVVATYIGEHLRASRTAARAGITPLFVTAVQLTLYLIVIVVGLDTMGVDVRILTTFARAFAFGLAGAVAIGLGVAFGLGSKDYVARNIEDWVEGARETATELDESLELDDPTAPAAGDGDVEETEA